HRSEHKAMRKLLALLSSIAVAAGVVLAGAAPAHADYITRHGTKEYALVNEGWVGGAIIKMRWQVQVRRHDDGRAFAVRSWSQVRCYRRQADAPPDPSPCARYYTQKLTRTGI